MNIKEELQYIEGLRKAFEKEAAPLLQKIQDCFGLCCEYDEEFPQVSKNCLRFLEYEFFNDYNYVTVRYEYYADESDDNGFRCFHNIPLTYLEASREQVIAWIAEKNALRAARVAKVAAIRQQTQENQERQMLRDLLAKYPNEKV